MSAVDLSVWLNQMRAELVAGLRVLQDVSLHPHIVRTEKVQRKTKMKGDALKQKLQDS